MRILHGMDLGIATALQSDLMCTFVYVANEVLDKDTGTGSRRAWKDLIASEAAMRRNTFAYNSHGLKHLLFPCDVDAEEQRGVPSQNTPSQDTAGMAGIQVFSTH